MSISLKANAAGTQGEILLNGVPALQIDSLTSSVKALAPFTLAGNGPAFIGTQAGPTGAGFAATVLTDIVASYDPTGAWNAATDRFQPTVAGLYQFNMRASAQTSQAMTYAGATIRKNAASGQLNNYIAPYSSGLYAQPAVSGMFYMNGTTDFVQFIVDASGPGGTLTWTDVQVSATLVRQA